MNLKKWNFLKDQNDYTIWFDRINGIQIISNRTGNLLKKYYSRNVFYFALYKNRNICYQYSVIELDLYLKGFDLLNKTVNEYIPKMIKKRKSKRKDIDGYHNFSNTGHLCIKCNLRYPKREMRGNICYLCKGDD